MPKNALCYLLIVSRIKVGMITHGWRTSLLLLLLYIGLWRHVHPITCEWAWLICIHKYIVGPVITSYSGVCKASLQLPLLRLLTVQQTSTRGEGCAQDRQQRYWSR